MKYLPSTNARSDRWPLAMVALGMRLRWWRNKIISGVEREITACLRIGNLEPLNVAMITHRSKNNDNLHIIIQWERNFNWEQMYSLIFLISFVSEKIDHSNVGQTVCLVFWKTSFGCVTRNPVSFRKCEIKTTWLWAGRVKRW